MENNLLRTAVLSTGLLLGACDNKPNLLDSSYEPISWTEVYGQDIKDLLEECAPNGGMNPNGDETQTDCVRDNQEGFSFDHRFIAFQDGDDNGTVDGACIDFHADGAHATVVLCKEDGDVYIEEHRHECDY